MPLMPAKPRRRCRWWQFLLALAVVAGAGRRLVAQEFVQQTLIVAPLHAHGDARLARQVASALRSRIARLSNRHELRVLDADTAEYLLEDAGFSRDTVVSDYLLRNLAIRLRADEIVTGTVTGKRGGPVEVQAEILLVRDPRMRQPLLTVRAATAAAVGDSLARQVVYARSQMAGLRRCENAARSGDPVRAVEEARRSVAGFPRSTLAKTCLAQEIAQAGVGADSVLAVTDELLAADSLNLIAAVLRADALSGMKRPGEAAAAWSGVVAMRPDSTELGVLAVEWMLRLHEASSAVATCRRLLKDSPAEPRLRRQLFRGYSALSDFRNAASLGDSLDAEDAEFRDDSVFAASHVAALREVGDTLAAMSLVARAVRQHQNDPILYLEYLQLVTAENGVALARGLERFPNVPELRVLAATAARTSGNAAGEMGALRDAIRLDSSMTRGYLRLAELWFAQHRVDSALATLARVPRSGEGADLLRSYAIGRGRQVLQAGSAMDSAYRTTITLFALADSVESRDDTRSLIAAVTMQLAQTELAASAKTHECPVARDAQAALSLANDALTRGVGQGASADELLDAYGKLNAFAESLTKSICTSTAREPSGDT